MPTFRVEFSRTVQEVIAVKVEAETAGIAHILAEEKACDARPSEWTAVDILDMQLSVCEEE